MGVWVCAERTQISELLALIKAHPNVTLPLLSTVPDDRAAGSGSHRIPFPSIAESSDRFTIVDDQSHHHLFQYFPRENLSQLITNILLRLIKPNRARACVMHGLAGYGKSHLLAAAVDLLLKHSTQSLYKEVSGRSDIKEVKTVYFSLARVNSVKSLYVQLRSALALAYANDTRVLDEISALTTAVGLNNFCMDHNHEILYVIDQWNSPVASAARDWLEGVCDLTLSVRAVSGGSEANELAVSDKQTTDLRLPYTGPLSAKEYDSWMEWYGDEMPRPLTPDQMENISLLTGRLPLYMGYLTHKHTPVNGRGSGGGGGGDIKSSASAAAVSAAAASAAAGSGSGGVGWSYYKAIAQLALKSGNRIKLEFETWMTAVGADQYCMNHAIEILKSAIYDRAAPIGLRYPAALFYVELRGRYSIVPYLIAANQLVRRYTIQFLVQRCKDQALGHFGLPVDWSLCSSIHDAPNVTSLGFLAEAGAINCLAYGSAIAGGSSASFAYDTELNSKFALNQKFTSWKYFDFEVEATPLNAHFASAPNTALLCCPAAFNYARIDAMAYVPPVNE